MFERAVRAALRAGFRRGLGEGSGPWMALGAAALAVRVVQRLSRPGRDDRVVEELAPGETLVITHLAKPS